jgi:DtxR family Mn-dependent transcriptional regulator
MSQSLSEENYLKAIYSLSQKGNAKITPTAVAEKLKVNAASVVDMLKKLSERKLISYNKEKGAKLTEKGGKIALTIVRNHRLWEVFLMEKLGYSWDVVHDIAEELEHVKHGELADRLEKFLGYPEYDPHGDPIPKSSGELPKRKTTTLTEVVTGKTCQVAAVKDSSPEFLHYLEHLSVGIGTKVKVIERISFDDSIVVQIGRDHRTNVSKKFSDNLLVV